MTAPSLNTHTADEATRRLRAEMRGEVVLPGDESYADVRRIWNGVVTHQPAIIALCEDVSDVQSAVRVTREHGIPLSVRGGGHDWAGRSLRDGGLTIDLSRMRQVKVDAPARVATIAGGALAKDVATGTTPHGLAAVTANIGEVGMAGFLLGGGYGGLTTRFGLGIDNLLGAELVLADGRRVWADASQNDDLFWAIRGGGGNFGVVTSMSIRLYPVREFLSGCIIFPWAQAPAVIRGYQEILFSAPDELAVFAAGPAGPDGSPMLLLVPVWSGEATEGEKYMARLQALGTPAMAQLARMSFTELLALYDGKVVAGNHYELLTRWVADLTPEVISQIVTACDARTSPHSFVLLQQFRGPGARVVPQATAFGQRRNHFMVEITTVLNELSWAAER